MPTGYRNSAGVDFEDLFEAGSTGAPGFRLSSGSNLAFAARGSAAKIADVGFRDSAGSDLSNLWLPKGSAPPVLGFNGQSYSAEAFAPTDFMGTTSGTLTLNMLANGTWSIVRNISGSGTGNGTTTLASGTWLPSGQSASNYEVQFNASGSGNATISNGAPSYANLGTNRSITLTASVPSASAQFQGGVRSITALLRAIGASASGSTCTFTVGAQGWQ
jgi:hypothetical protein